MALWRILFLVALSLNWNHVLSTFVNRSQQNLDALPRDLPADVTFLELSHNQISSIPDDAFHGLTELRTLAITYNNIKNVSHFALRGLQSIEIIWLGANSLTTILPFTMIGSTLRVLGLNNNEISFIPRWMVAMLGKLEELRLSGNPLVQVPDFSRIKSGQLTKLLVIFKNMSVECCSAMAEFRNIRNLLIDEFPCSNHPLDTASWNTISEEQLMDIHCTSKFTISIAMPCLFHA